MRLAEEQGKFQALEYDAGSFPPESNLITNPSLERLPYEIPRIRPKQVTVYPSHGARIVDPRVETPDGQRVNVLLEGDSYVYRYRVEVTDAARPQDLRDDVLADVVILRSLMRAAAEASAIDEQGFAVGRDQQQGIPLAYVDGLHQQCVVWVIDRARQNSDHGCQ